MGEAEVHGIGAGFHRGMELGPMSDGAQNFGPLHTSIL